MKHGRGIASGLAIVVALMIVFVLRGRQSSGVRAIIPLPPVRAPEGVRVRVQVLNSTKTRGLARRATMLLRDRGFDVVETGTIAQGRDTTMVLDLSGHPDWANRIAQIFAPAKVAARADSSRYLAIAVVLGETWRPPAQPFNP